MADKNLWSPETLAQFSLFSPETHAKFSLQGNPSAVELQNRRSMEPANADSAVDQSVNAFLDKTNQGTLWDFAGSIPAWMTGLPGDVQEMGNALGQVLPNAGGPGMDSQARFQDQPGYQPAEVPFPTTRDMQQKFGVNPDSTNALLGEFVDPPRGGLAMAGGIIKRGAKRAPEYVDWSLPMKDQPPSVHRLVKDLDLQTENVTPAFYPNSNMVDPANMKVELGPPEYGHDVMRALIDREGSEAAALRKLDDYGISGSRQMADEVDGFAMSEEPLNALLDVKPQTRLASAKGADNALVGGDELLGRYPTTTAGRIRNKTQNEGGYSVQMKTGEEPDSGLFMGKYKNTDPRNKVLEGNVTKADIQDFVKTNEKALLRLENHLGTWKEDATGKIYMDVSTRFEPDEIRKATKFGERTNQIAGFNKDTFETFPVGNWDEFIKSPDFNQRMMEMQKAGQEYLKAHPTAEWWDIHGTLFEEVYGKENLEALAGYIASTAPNTNPTQNLQIATEFMRRHLLGEDIIQPNWRIPAGTMSRNEGVKLSMHENHPNNLIASSEGRIDDLRADKVRSEAKALLGDPDAAVFDRWWARIAEDAKQGVYTATQEGAFESARKTYNQYEELYKVVKEAAESQGRSVRDFSADVWTGIRETVKSTDELFGTKYKGSALTGESKGYADLFDDLIKSKAEFLGISVEKLKDRLSKGDAELLSLIIGAPLGAHAFSLLNGASSESGHTPGVQHPNALVSAPGQGI